jgi:hypothetical protein
MKATPKPKTELQPGDRTVLGIVTETKLSPSGKTMVITVRNPTDGHLFTDRIAAAGNMYVFEG